MRERYQALLAGGDIQPDPAQARIVEALAALADQLNERALARKESALGWLFGRARADEPTRGLYVWGDVGRGKTMLTDLFHDSVTPVLPKRRVHFHAFMNDVHERIFRHRNAVKAGTAKGEDPIPAVAEALADEARLLCFDEFRVTDIADAMIIGRLFTGLFARRVVVVATSNIEPDRLYENGLNRALFLPFVALLKEHVDILRLDARTDYRLEKLSAGTTYLVATGPAARQALDIAFRRLAGTAQGRPRTLRIKGRDLAVPEAALGVARFSFDELCRRPLGPADFLAIAQTFHTLVVDAIPVMRTDERDVVRRFITLIDTLYDRGAKLVASAEAEPADLLQGGEGREAFEFSRTVSRLMEMRSQDYLSRPHAAPPAGAALVET